MLILKCLNCGFEFEDQEEIKCPECHGDTEVLFGEHDPQDGWALSNAIWNAQHANDDREDDKYDTLDVHIKPKFGQFTMDEIEDGAENWNLRNHE